MKSHENVEILNDFGKVDTNIETSTSKEIFDKTLKF